MQRISTKKLVLYALFIALTLLLGLTPLGLIPLGFINVTILCIPVVIGTIVLGLKAGLLFGACFGLASTLSAFGLSMAAQSGLAAALLAVNPFYVLLLCFVPRLLVPVVTYSVYKLATKNGQGSLRVIPAAIAGSLTNTVLYLGLLLVFFTLAGLDSTPILAIIGGTGLIAGSLEALAAALIATPVVRVLLKIKD